MANSLLSAGTAPERAVAALPRRDRILIAGCIAVVAALAWWYLFHLERSMSAPAMPMVDMALHTQWSARDLLFTFAMWSVMMVGMMSPPAAPMLVMFAAMHPRGQKRLVHRDVLLFGSGYIIIWFGFSALAALSQWSFHSAGVLSPAMALVSPKHAAALLVAAGVYQLTPLKQACLSHCQSPLGFMMSRWRAGPWGALRMGTRHGQYCLGCCWAVMCVLFAVGVMNLAWVALLSAFILAEKIAPFGAVVARAGGALMLAAGLLFLFR
jgi:predicted metal-binding membrane protein